VHRSVRIGIELPVLPRRARPDDVAAWRSIAVAADECGAGAVWIADGACDPCTLAGGLVPATEHVVLGVVCALAGRRHPAIVARDVTGLDVTSRGRAGVLLDGAPDELDDAVAICRALFAGESPRFAGQHYRVDGAVNRPLPVRPGGPMLFAQSPRGVGPRPASVDGWVVTGLPESAADEDWVAGEDRTGRVWRGRVPDRRFAADLYDAGIDGVIALVETVDDVRPLVDVLVERWAG
jgi:alkanesulfonate monooxygenase SsuD/methylene tetrahydromethanopterin reductase-like flavin-dependent oxidoreductase (luciferase family)